MDATYYFDPICPFTWRTSRWLVAAAAERGATVHWRAFSLSLLNDAAPGASDRALRLVEALHADNRGETAAAFYTELGTRTHEAGTKLTDDIVLRAAEAAGVDDPKTVLDDERWDDAVRASHERALELAGPGIGSPVLHVEGAPRGLHGPIIGAVPTGDEALTMWDATVALMRLESFFEVKRGRS